MSTPDQTPDVPMLLARIDEDEALIAGLRHRCAALACEVNMLRRAVAPQSQALTDQAEPHRGADDGLQA